MNRYLHQPTRPEHVDEVLDAYFHTPEAYADLLLARRFVQHFREQLNERTPEERARLAGGVYCRLSQLEQKPFPRTPQRDSSGYLRKCLAEYVVEQRPKHLDRDFKSALSRDVEYGPLLLTAGLTLISSQLDLIESEPSGDDDDSGKTTQGQAVPFDPRNIWSPQPEAEPDGGALSDEGAKSFGMFFIVLTIGFLLAFILL